MEWVQEVIRRMAPRLAPSKWRNTLRITKEWPLRGCCWKTVMLLLLLEIKWGFAAVPLLRQCWNSGIRPYSENPEKPRKLFWNGWPPKIASLGNHVIAQGPALPLSRILQNTAWKSAKPLQYVRAEPLLNIPAQLLHKSLIRNCSQKNCVPLSQDCVVFQCSAPPQCQRSELLQKDCWKYLAQVGTRSPPGLRVRSPLRALNSVADRLNS